MGKQLRLRRLMLGLTQQELAASAKLVQQQLQLYERGTSRISAGRLYALSRALGVPVEYFFEGLTTADSPDMPTASTTARDEPKVSSAPELPDDGRSHREAFTVLRAYQRIVDPKDRKAVLDLLKRFGSEET